MVGEGITSPNVAVRSLMRVDGAKLPGIPPRQHGASVGHTCEVEALHQGWEKYWPSSTAVSPPNNYLHIKRYPLAIPAWIGMYVWV